MATVEVEFSDGRIRYLYFGTNELHIGYIFSYWKNEILDNSVNFEIAEISEDKTYIFVDLFKKNG